MALMQTLVTENESASGAQDATKYTKRKIIEWSAMAGFVVLMVLSTWAYIFYTVRRQDRRQKAAAEIKAEMQKKAEVEKKAREEFAKRIHDTAIADFELAPLTKPPSPMYRSGCARDLVSFPRVERRGSFHVVAPSQTDVATFVPKTHAAAAFTSPYKAHTTASPVFPTCTVCEACTGIKRSRVEAMRDQGKLNLD